MRVVVTGRDGQVARSLLALGPKFKAEVICLGRPVLDLSEPVTIARAITAAKPDVVINAAAFTAVDKAESEPELARAVNTHGAGQVARAAAQYGVPILHLSTDYVFDGGLNRPYREDDDTNPLSVYGRTKLEGELAVAVANPAHVIFRTAWVYSPFGQNFVKTMLRLAATRGEIGVVADQYGCPTSALEIARAILTIARRIVEEGQRDRHLFGVFNLSARGEASWADVAEATFARSQLLGGPEARVRRIQTQDYPTPAKRPANSRLDSSKLGTVYGLGLPFWQSSLDECVTALLRREGASTSAAPAIGN